MMKSHFLKIQLDNHPVIEDLQQTLKQFEKKMGRQNSDKSQSGSDNSGLTPEFRWTEPSVWQITLGRLSHPTFNKKQQKEADDLIHAIVAQHAPILLEFSGNADIEYRSAALEIVSEAIEKLQKTLQEKLSDAGYKFIAQKPKITIALKTSDFKEDEKKLIHDIGEHLKNKKYEQSLHELHRIAGSMKSASFKLSGRNSNPSIKS